MASQEGITALTVVPEETEVSLGTLQARSARELVSGATQLANELAGIIESRKLALSIVGRKYVKVEGWTTLSVMLGCVAREVSNERLEDDSYLATVELVRISDGQMIARASAECGMDEPSWQSRPRFARRSMAATRATGKACRLAFSWIMALAGYEPTPAEEMHEAEEKPVEMPRRKAPAKKAAPAPPPPPPEPANRVFKAGQEPKESAETFDPLIWTGWVTIKQRKGVNKKGEPYTLTTIIGRDGTQFTTFDTTLAATVKEIAESGPVSIRYTVKEFAEGKHANRAEKAWTPADVSDDEVPF